MAMYNQVMGNNVIVGKKSSVPRALPVMNEPPKVIDEIKMFKLSLDNILKIINEKCGPVEIKEYGDGSYNVVFLPEAAEALKAMLYWGKYHPINVYEQQFQGIGHIFIDEKGAVTVVVVMVFYIYSAKRSPVSATIFEDPRDGMFKRLESERDIFNHNLHKRNDLGNGRMIDPFIKYGSCFVNLFGHTHPCNIGLFFSGPDRASSIATEHFPAATFVCDPQEKNMLAAVGADMQPAKIHVCHYVNENNDCNFAECESNKLPQDKIANMKKSTLYKSGNTKSYVMDKQMSEKNNVVNMQNNSKDIERTLNSDIDKRSNKEIITTILNDCNTLVSRGYKGRINTIITDNGKHHLRFDIRG